jgi:RNA polymerase sigma-70 factor (ECF subfamily)
MWQEVASGFLEARAASGAPWGGDPRIVEEILGDHLAAARRAFPAVTVAAARFGAHVAVLAGPAATEADLRGLRGDELYLARACADGDPAAIALFEERYFPEVDVAAGRLRAPRSLADDVKQMLRRGFFVAEPDRPPAIEKYAGRGDLRGWVRVSAVRELQRLLAREKRNVHVEDDRFFEAFAPASDPELGLIRARYERELKEALLVALAAIPERERALLRLHVLHGLSIDKIAELYGAHRATAARWLATARAGIFERTRAELSRRIGASESEVDSIIRLVQSKLEVSLNRVL